MLTNVSYKYPGAAGRALTEMSLSIRTGSSVGIIGATGSGKSTLLDIILGLLEPDSGEIRLGDQEIIGQAKRAWQQMIGYVPQSIFLSDASIAANIAFGVPQNDIDISEVRQAAKLACLDDFVMGELPAGYDTFVGERGVRISGGQRQRLGIARALYQRPRVLVLDEATSALDGETERRVISSLEDMDWKITKVMVAHRLTSLQDCDLIFQVEHGKLVRVLTYADLIRDGQVSSNA